jgi:hypothetical protein
LSDKEYTDYEEIAAGRVEIQSMARRQLGASVIVAFIIAAAFGLATLRPGSHVAADAVITHKIAVQHPSLVAPRVAAARNGVDLP